MLTYSFDKKKKVGVVRKNIKDKCLIEAFV